MSDDDTSGDGIATRPSPRDAEPDAHGQAALLLAESILHTLLQAKVLTRDQAIDTVQTAADVKVDMASETGESGARMRRSLGLLAAMKRSLVIDGADAAND